VERSGVRHCRLLQIGGRAGRADGEMGEGWLGRASRWRGKEGAHGRQPDHGVGVAPSSAVGCGSTRSLRRWACE
jgi:hypothetical protein